MKFYMDGGRAEGEVRGYTLAGDGLPAGSTRQQLLATYRAGNLASVSFPARVFASGPNKNHFVIPDGELEAFAASFVGRPFLKDHTYTQDSVGGTITESVLVEHEGKKTIRQTIEAVKPWAIESVLDRTINRFSIGWDAQREVCTSCETDFMKCSHGHRDLGKIDPETGKQISIRTEGNEGIEVSAVVNPAVPGTGVEALCQLKESMRSAIPAESFIRKGEEEMRERLFKLLSLPPDTGEEEALKALEQRLSPKVPAAMLTALGFKPDAAIDEVEVLARVMALTAPDAAVPKDQHEKTVAELKMMKARQRVAELKAERKITPHHEEWALKQAIENSEAFEAFYKNAPPQTGLGLTPPALLTTDPAVSSGFSGFAAEICGKFGVTEEEYLKVVIEEKKMLVAQGRS